MDHLPRTGGDARRAAALTLAALALLGFGVAVFVDHIASYYLLQWAPSLRRYPTNEERVAVFQALAMDRAVHVAMWLTLATSLMLWRRGAWRRELSPDPVRALPWVASGVASYAVLRVAVESQLAIDLVRVPNMAIGIDWHGPGFAVAGVALLLFATLLASPTRVRSAVERRVPR